MSKPKTYPTRDYLVESLLPLRSLNLLAGPSGSGKTRLLFQWLEELERHGTLLGKKLLVREIKPLYICFDRPIEAVHDLLNRMGMFFSFPLRANLKNSSLPKIPAETNLLIIDGIDCLVEKSIDFQSVREPLLELVQLAEKHNFCILGLLGTAKLKVGSHYSSVRERIAGSGAWGRFSEFLSVIEPLNPEEKASTKRILTVDPRVSRPFNIHLDTDSSGRLIPFIPTSEAEELLEKLPFEFTPASLMRLAACSEISAHRILKRWLASCPSPIRKLGHGSYQKTDGSPKAESKASQRGS